MKLNGWIVLAGLAGMLLGAGQTTQAQSLEQRLTAEDPAKLAQTALQFGDARRGAIIFYQPYLACRKCHLGGKTVNSLGPDLAKSNRKTTDAHIVESVLNPSKIIRKGFEPITVVTTAGKTIVGLLVQDGKNELTLRDPSRNGLLVKIPKSKVEEQLPGKLSIMPTGQVNLLASRQQFLDLVRYLIEIRDGGAARARELEPPPALFAARPLPEYEKHIDHAGMLSSLDLDSFKRGTQLKIGSTKGINLKTGDFTVTARIKTKTNGTILAQTDDTPKWVPNGLTWFIRGGRLAVDIGWVGAFQGQRVVFDGKWHHVAFSYKQKTGEIRFYIDGTPEQRTGTLKRKAPLKKPVVRIGYTPNNFPNPTFFKGEIPEVRFYNAVLSANDIKAAAKSKPLKSDALVAHWDLTTGKNNIVLDKTGNKHNGKLVVGKVTGGTPSQAATGWTVAGAAGNTEGLRWSADKGDLRLRIPAGRDPLRLTVWFALIEKPGDLAPLVDAVALDRPDRDLTAFTGGGPARWPQELESEAILGADDGPFAIDVLQRPTDNPWFCRMRLTGFDFTPDGNEAIVCAWDGSVWRVSGLKQLPDNTPAKGDDRRIKLKWRRIASGLFQPLGVKIVQGEIYITCRDQICILHDLNGDGEIDHFENFNNDHQVTDHFHEFAMGLQTDKEGNFYYAKSARHALKALVPHHGTLLRVSRDGSRTDIVANGFRAANGVCINPDGTFIVTDQEGHWNPKNRINWVKEGGFYGNMFGYHDVTDSSDEAMQQPLCWITNAFDRSPAELLWVDSPRWGALDGKLLNLSYGYGQVYVVPHEDVDGQKQGGMCALPIPRFPTGVMRGRFHPADGQLYLCGMFAWAGSQTQPGGLYRLRYTGKPAHLPVGLSARKNGMAVTFTDTLDAASARDPKNYSVKVWSLKRTAGYGSKHYNERSLKVTSATVSRDGKQVFLQVPEIAPAWSMEISYEVQSATGKPIRGKIHNTIHKLNP